MTGFEFLKASDLCIDFGGGWVAFVVDFDIEQFVGGDFVAFEFFSSLHLVD